MKKIILTVLLFVSATTVVLAQPPGPGRGVQKANIEALKIAFMTKQLSLTGDEAQKFWPVYFAYFEEIKAAHRDKKEDELAFEESALNIRKKYKGEFKKILNSDDRANKVLKADRDFNDMIRKELRQRAEKRGFKRNPREEQQP